MGFPGGGSGKEPGCQETWDTGLVPEMGRSLGGGHGIPLQYSCMENTTDGGAWRATVHRGLKSRTWLRWPSTHARSQDIFFTSWFCFTDFLLITIQFGQQESYFIIKEGKYIHRYCLPFPSDSWLSLGVYPPVHTLRPWCYEGWLQQAGDGSSCFTEIRVESSQHWHE